MVNDFLNTYGDGLKPLFLTSGIIIFMDTHTALQNTSLFVAISYTIYKFYKEIKKDRKR